MICVIQASRGFPAAFTVVIEVAARGSGSLLRRFRRFRRLLRGIGQVPLLALSLTACGGGQVLQAADPAQSATAGKMLLTPQQSIQGGRLATGMDATGTPKPGSMRGFVNFISPAALAVRGPDLYVADMGARKLYRLDTMQQVLSVVPNVSVSPRMQLQVASDLSLYILDPDHATIHHLTRGGRLLQTFADAGIAVHLTHFVLDEGMGRIIASDQLSQRLLRLPLAGRIVSVLPDAEVGTFRAVGAVASIDGEMYALDTACVCIVQLDADGGVLQRFGYGALTQPHAMVADRHGRLFVADAFDRELKVFFRGELIARYAPHQLNLVNISGLAMGEGLLYVADGAASRVVAFRIQSPARAGDGQAR